MSGGGVKGVEIAELRDRVLALEESFTELAKWTKFNQQEKKNTGNNGAATAPSPVANVDGVAVSVFENPVGFFNADEENVKSNGNLEGELCNAEAMDANEDRQGNENGIRNPQGTSSDTILPVAQIPETAASVSNECQNDGQMPSAAGSGSGVEEQGSNDKGVIPPQIKTEGDETCRCKLENESDCSCSSEENDSSIRSLPKTTRKIRTPPKKKSTTIKKSSSLELKSPFVSLKRLSSSQILSIKKKMALKSKPQWKCPHCPRILTRKSHLEIHIRCHTGERPFHCPHCSEARMTAEHLRLHIRNIHPKENQNSIPCRICQQKFPTQKTLRVHMKKRHPDSLRCYFCSHMMRNFSDMQQHILIHTGEKSFSCPHCLYSSAWERSLRLHIQRKHRNTK